MIKKSKRRFHLRLDFAQFESTKSTEGKNNTNALIVYRIFL
jgi:hypothetical protein